MKVNGINVLNPKSFKSIGAQDSKDKPIETKSFLDKFATSAKNNADMTDTVVVPRTIFKGYLEVMTGTALITLGGILKKALGKTLLAAGTVIATYGAYSFVRPFIIKDTPGVEKTKN